MISTQTETIPAKVPMEIIINVCTCLCRQDDWSDPMMEGDTVYQLFIAVATSGECTSSAYPAINTDVFSVVKWIKQTTKIKDEDDEDEDWGVMSTLCLLKLNKSLCTCLSLALIFFIPSSDFYAVNKIHHEEYDFNF